MPSLHSLKQHLAPVSPLPPNSCFRATRHPPTFSSITRTLISRSRSEERVSVIDFYFSRLQKTGSTTTITESFPPISCPVHPPTSHVHTTPTTCRNTSTRTTHALSRKQERLIPSRHQSPNVSLTSVKRRSPRRKYHRSFPFTCFRPRHGRIAPSPLNSPRARPTPSSLSALSFPNLSASSLSIIPSRSTDRVPVLRFT